MSIDPLTVAASAAIGAVAADVYDKGKDKAQSATGQSTIEHGPIELHMLVDMVSRIEQAIHEAKAANCPPLIVVKKLPASSLGTQGFVYERRGYKHVSVLAAAAVSVIVQTQIGQITFNLNVGWNAFDMPDHSEMWASGANAASVIFYFGDDALDIPGV